MNTFKHHGTNSPTGFPRNPSSLRWMRDICLSSCPLSSSCVSYLVFHSFPDIRISRKKLIYFRLDLCRQVNRLWSYSKQRYNILIKWYKYNIWAYLPHQQSEVFPEVHIWCSVNQTRTLRAFPWWQRVLFITVGNNSVESWKYGRIRWRNLL